jgi:hypothetical protein
MLFNSVIATAILASSAFAALQFSRRNRNSTKPVTITLIAPLASITAAIRGLSLIVQLFLVDTVVDRFTLLLKDSDFVFDFIAEGAVIKGKVGKRGDLVTVNRKTFPALVNINTRIAVGFLGPYSFNTPHVYPRSVEL